MKKQTENERQLVEFANIKAYYASQNMGGGMYVDFLQITDDLWIAVTDECACCVIYSDVDKDFLCMNGMFLAGEKADSIDLIKMNKMAQDCIDEHFNSYSEQSSDEVMREDEAERVYKAYVNPNYSDNLTEVIDHFTGIGWMAKDNQGTTWFVKHEETQ